MKVFEQSKTLQVELKKARQANLTIGLVPTMGNLHSGHLTLVKSAKQNCDIVIATIFINPSQFGPNEDFDNYPKTIEADQQNLIEAGCDILFMPSINEMYPSGLKHQTTISAPAVSSLHCGASRPGHFDGVCTIVNKLFNLSQPDQAYFGEKDFQQLFIIKKMLKDLCIPIEIHGIPTQREPSGLALSSRNGYLTPTEKHTAAALYDCLKATKAAILDKQQSTYTELEEAAKQTLRDAGMRPDYFTICNANTLQLATPEDQPLVILVAAYLGSTRLIDNILVISD